MNNFNDKVSFICSVADLLRSPYKPAQYDDVMLLLVVLRRLDCLLDPTKAKVLERYAALKGQKHTEAELDAILNRVANQQFYSTKMPSAMKDCSRRPKPTRSTTSPTSSTDQRRSTNLTGDFSVGSNHYENPLQRRNRHHQFGVRTVGVRAKPLSVVIEYG